MRTDQALNLRNQHRPVLYPAPIGRKTLIRGQQRNPGHLTEPLELAVITHCQDDMPIRSRKGLIGHDIGMRVAQPLRGLPGGKIIERLIRQHADLHIHQGKIYPCSFASPVPTQKGGKNRGCGVHAGEQINHRHPHFHGASAGLVIRLSGYIHQPPHTLQEEVVACALGVRAILTKPGNRTIYEVRLDLFKALIVQPVTFQATNLEVFQYHITGGNQFPDQGLSLRLSYIDCDRAFASIG